MKRQGYFFSLILVFLFSITAQGQEKSKIDVVVIDPGHGGHDPGALGSKSKEKDIVLSISLKTGKLIEEHFPDVKVIYTRKTDKFVELHERARIANENHADIFMSVHCNANPSSRPYGAETYVMGLHKSLDNLEVAKKENAAILMEENYEDEYDGFDPNSDEEYIALSMFQSAFLDQSLGLSAKVQHYFHNHAARRDRGVKQAGFLVLYRTTMPGILIEAGFLSNPTEEKFLVDPDGQQKIARSIFSAFRDYKQEFEENNKYLDQPAIVEDTSAVTVPVREVFFRVQFASFKREKDLDSRRFRGLQDVRKYFHNDAYKYTCGNCRTLGEAKSLKKKMIDEGYSDVFIVAFEDDKRISLDEAMKVSENNPR